MIRTSTKGWTITETALRRQKPVVCADGALHHCERSEAIVRPCWTRPGGKRDSPGEETIDWRAVCGKTARTVRREGRCKSLPYPYHLSTRQSSTRSQYRSC